MNRLTKGLFAFVITSLLFSQVASANTATAIAGGAVHACALTTAGGVQCWGYNYFGELGDNRYTDSDTPVDVVGLGSGVAALAAGGYHTCALTTAGGVKCWGWNYRGQLGNSTNVGTYNPVSTPVDVVGLGSGVAAIAAGYDYNCALTTTGSVKCWGDNADGQLGNSTNVGTYNPNSTPADVVGLGSGVAAIAGGGYHTCALTTAGGVKCWGYNGYGQLGDNSTTQRNAPVDVVGLGSGVAAIAAGFAHTCAVTTVGGVKCWGDNADGRLGNSTNVGTYNPNSTPVDVVGLGSGVAAIAAGESHTCAVTTAGGVKCWGNNGYGQLGDNSTTERHTPVDVMDLGGGMVAIATGGFHTCAMTTGGGVKCWGNNSYGQLGDVCNMNHYTPVAVIGFGATAIKFCADAIKNNFNNITVDVKSDVLFLNSSTGAVRYWSDASKSHSIYIGTYSTDYSYAGSGDFDGNGKADILFTRASNRFTLIWKGANKFIPIYPGSSTAGFNVAAICDTNGDGKDDVLWFNPTTGGTQIWSGAVKASVTYPGTQAAGYSVAACADFDGDGKADIFWHNSTSGANQIWLSGNKSTVIYPGATTDLTWVPFGAGDVDGNGKSDLVWYRASNNNTMVWKGGLKSAITYPGAGAAGFTPKAIGDYDGDGKADLLWANDSTLATEIWPGVVRYAVTNLGFLPAGFAIQK
jgi:alpha-tubulin suppressor-like RCC1 family protein